MTVVTACALARLTQAEFYMPGQMPYTPLADTDVLYIMKEMG